MKETLKIVLVSALATAALIRGVPALAEPAAETNVTVVETADLDLSNADDKRRLERRLVTAAHAVCDDASAADLRGRNGEAQCRAAVLAAARARADAILAGADARRGIAIATRQ
jgi:UrcA family protein